MGNYLSVKKQGQRRKMKTQVVELAIRLSMAQKRSVGNPPFSASLSCVRLRSRRHTPQTHTCFYFEWRISNSTIMATILARRIAISFARRIANSLIRTARHKVPIVSPQHEDTVRRATCVFIFRRWLGFSYHCLPSS